MRETQLARVKDHNIHEALGMSEEDYPKFKRQVRIEVGSIVADLGMEPWPKVSTATKDLILKRLFTQYPFLETDDERRSAVVLVLMNVFTNARKNLNRSRSSSTKRQTKASRTLGASVKVIHDPTDLVDHRDDPSVTQLPSNIAFKMKASRASPEARPHKTSNLCEDEGLAVPLKFKKQWKHLTKDVSQPQILRETLDL